MNAHAFLSLALPTTLVLLAAPAQAQFGGFLDKVLPPVLRGAAPEAPPHGNVPGLVPRDSPSAAIAEGAAPAIRRKDVTAELQPDRECKRPQERFNIVESSHPPTAEREVNYKNKVEGRSGKVRKASSRRPARPQARP